MIVAISILGAAAITYMLVGAVKKWTGRHMLDVPNERSSHVMPTPRGGGSGIVAVVVATWLLGTILLGLPKDRFLAQAAGLLVVAAVGFIDDLRSLPSAIRLLVHCGAALLALGIGGWFDSMTGPMGTTIALKMMGVPFTFLWVVGLLNAYNFMDGIDGLAGIQGAIAGFAWALVGFAYGAHFYLILGASIAGSCFGFLGYNWPPARIFMGDVGSTFLGYLFAVMPLFAERIGFPQEALPRLPLLALSFVWVFVFDTAFTFIRRSFHGERIFAAHRTHLYQRLVAGGMTHGQVTTLYGALSIVVSGVAILEARGHIPFGVAILSMFATGLLLLLWTRSMPKLQMKMGT